MKFYKCKHCGNIITYLHNSGVKVMCCGEEMLELVANSVDASGEKHVPVLEETKNGVLVKVGSIEHPMSEEHHIEWIVLEVKDGFKLVNLKSNSKPEALFEGVKLNNVVAVYSYCNLHGLWTSK